MKNVAKVRKVDRVAIILIHKNNVLLMYRVNDGKSYYTFPGGGIDKGETNELALERECMEETSIKIEPERLLYEVTWEDNMTKQLFYLCSYIEGKPMLGDFNEKEAMKDGTQYYDPKWVPASKLEETLLYPLEVRDLLIHDLKQGFKKEQKLQLNLLTCRQSL